MDEPEEPEDPEVCFDIFMWILGRLITVCKIWDDSSDQKVTVKMVGKKAGVLVRLLLYITCQTVYSWFFPGGRQYIPGNLLECGFKPCGIPYYGLWATT